MIYSLEQNEKALKSRIEELETKLKEKESQGNLQNEVTEKRFQDILSKFFTTGQIKCILKNKKKIQWSIDDTASAISLRSESPKDYRYLREKLNYPLPTFSTLSSMGNKFKFRGRDNCINWITFISKGHLTYPTEKFFSIIKILEDIF